MTSDNTPAEPDLPEDPFVEASRSQSRQLATVMLGLVLATVAAGLTWLAYRNVPKTAAEQLARAETLERELAGQQEKLDEKQRAQYEQKVVDAYGKVFDGSFEDDPAAATEAHRRLIRLHGEADRAAEAVETAKQLAERYPEAEVVPDELEHVAKLAEDKLDAKVARELWQKLADGYPRDDRAPGALYRAAWLLDNEVEGAERKDKVAAYRAVVETFPKSEEAPRSLWRVAELEEADSRWMAALEVYRELAQRFADTDWAPRAMRRQIELLRDKLDRPEDAKTVLGELLEKYPDSDAARALRGEQEEVAREASGKRVERAMRKRYGGGSGGGVIYDYAARFTEAKKKLFAQIGAQRLDYTKVELDCTFDPAKTSAQVEVAITLTHGQEKPTDQLLLFLGNMVTVASVKVDGQAVETQHQEERLAVFLKAPLKPATPAVVEVKYALQDPGAEKRGPVFQLRLDETGFAMADCGWYPANVFGDLFAYRASYTLPEAFRVIAPGAGGEVEKLEGGLARTTWTSEGSHPSYALYFNYGKYAVAAERTWKRADGQAVDLKLWALPGKEAWKGAAGTLELVEKTLAYYAELYGAFPYKKLWVTQVELPKLFAGVGPASLVWLNSTHFEKDDVPTAVMAHELAHQWWGNRVPVALFGTEGYSQWLSEGLATYSEVMLQGQLEGEQAMTEQLAKYRKMYLDITRGHHERPLSQKLGGGPGYFAVVYMKGCWVLHTLRWQIGDEAFFAAMRRYSEDFAWKGSSVADFRRLIEEAHGSSLETFFADWVDGIGAARFDLSDVRRRELPPVEDEPKPADEPKSGDAPAKGKPEKDEPEQAEPEQAEPGKADEPKPDAPQDGAQDAQPEKDGEQDAQQPGEPAKQAGDGKPGAANEGKPGAANEGKPGAANDGKPGAANDGKPGAANDGKPGKGGAQQAARQAPRMRYAVELTVRLRATKVWEPKDKQPEQPGPEAERRAPFRTPVAIVVTGETPEQRHEVRVEVKTMRQTVTLEVPFEPRAVTVDPDDRWLKVPGDHNTYRW